LRIYVLMFCNTQGICQEPMSAGILKSHLNPLARIIHYHQGSTNFNGRVPSQLPQQHCEQTINIRSTTHPKIMIFKLAYVCRFPDGTQKHAHQSCTVPLGELSIRGLLPGHQLPPPPQDSCAVPCSCDQESCLAALSFASHGRLEMSTSRCQCHPFSSGCLADLPNLVLNW